MFKLSIVRSLPVLCALLLPALARALPPEGLAALQHHWAEAYYSLPKDQQRPRFEALVDEAGAFVAAHPGNAEALIWQGIITSSLAKFDGGPHALGLVKQARAQLLQAEKIDPRAADGSVYTSLGSLYASVPGWPLSFGDRDKAAEYLEKALALNPDGIDPNYFYAELLHARGKDREALPYLKKALAAPARPGREDADAGRRKDVDALAAELHIQ